MVGSGWMGDSMVRRLLGAGHACVVYDKQLSAEVWHCGSVNRVLSAMREEFGGHAEKSAA